jgi:hypothetical protein
MCANDNEETELLEYTGVCTRQTLGLGADHEYPLIQIKWQQTKDKLGWQGDIVIWEKRDKGSVKRNIGKHTVLIRQTIPLGHINIWLDPFAYGSRASANFFGVEITERDFQWATSWAIALLRNVEPKDADEPATAVQ